jgi:ubiquinone/menaquinone biosynthesis C-methylase UbiE
VNNAAFDRLAQTYDSEFTNTGVGRALRDLVWSRFDRLFAAGQTLVELGCGTGEDALYLARCGVRVVATDAAPEMVGVAQAKAVQRGLAHNVEFHAVPMEGLRAKFSDRRFDGAISNFGAINCACDLPSLAEDMASLLKPGAPLLWVAMGKHVPWEWFWYMAQGKPRKAFRRYGTRGVEWRGMRVHYPTPRDLSQLLAPFFRIGRIAPLGCVLPPSYAATWLNRRRKGLHTLIRAERLAQNASFLASVADHYMIEAYRKLDN